MKLHETPPTRRLLGVGCSVLFGLFILLWMDEALCSASLESEQFSQASRNSDCTQERCMSLPKSNFENKALTLLAAPLTSNYGNTSVSSCCESSCPCRSLAYTAPKSFLSDQAGSPSALQQATISISQAKYRSAMGFVLLVIAMMLLLIGARWPRMGEVSHERFPKSVCRDTLLCLLLGSLLMLAGRFLVESWHLGIQSLPNVKAHPPLGATPSVETEVEP